MESTALKIDFGGLSLNQYQNVTLDVMSFALLILGQFILGADAVARSYEYIARMCNKNACEFFIDSYYNHLWTIPPRSSWKSAIDTNSTCCCGHIKFNGSMNFRSILEKPTACNYSGELQNVNSQDKELPDVLDLLVVKRASMTLATELANTVLRIKHTIIDNG